MAAQIPDIYKINWKWDGFLAEMWPEIKHPWTGGTLLYCDPEHFEWDRHSWDGGFTVPLPDRVVARFNTGCGAWVDGIRVLEPGGRWYWRWWGVPGGGGFGLSGPCTPDGEIDA